MKQRFKIDLRGIIDLTANHLYSSPDVFVRELIQNGVDAITARRGIEQEFAGCVRLELTPGDDERPSTLCVIDDGIGLTTAEVHEFLSTVGGSSKREKMQSIDKRIAKHGEGFLGRFGIGLLSCYMVTDEIVVVTRSAHDAWAPPVEWRGRSDGSYTVRELTNQQLGPGTSVFISARRDAEFYFDKDMLLELARKFGEMLRVPIKFVEGHDEVCVNRECTPWEMSLDDDVALSDLCENMFGFRPLDVFRLEAAGKVEGLAFVRPDHGSEGGPDHRLYAHGMLVSESVRGLVPTWATFVACILNTRELRLTAARDNVHQDKQLEDSREQLAAAIRYRLVNLLRTDRAKFSVVMGVHDTEIRGLAVKDREFFALVIDLLEFETTLGAIRFGEFRREHERLSFARTGEQFRRISAIAAAAGVRVFNGGYTYHEELLTRAVERFPELQLRSFDSVDLVDSLPAPGDESRFAGLLEAGERALEGRGCEVAVRDFEPADVGAFFALGTDAEYHRQIDRTKAMSSGLWMEILNVMAPRPDFIRPTKLCLNARSPLIRRLATFRDADLQSTAIEVIYVQSLMSGQHALTADELAMLNRGMDKLLVRVAEAAS